MITQQRVLLRRFDKKADINLFHKVHSDAESMKYYGMSAFDSVEQSRRLMDDYIQSEKKNMSFHRVICDPVTHVYMGEIGLFNINGRHQRATAYCILLPEQRKKGISVDASILFYRTIFNQLNINRVQALVDSRNEEAKASLNGIGFVFEGKMLQYEFFENEYIDIEVFALLKKRFYELYGE